MLRVAITQAEAHLAKARAAEAADIAKKEANEAREIAASLKTLGASMDTALDNFLANYRKYQDAAVRLDQLEYPPYNDLNPLVQGHLALVLQSAGFTHLDTYHVAACRKTFETVLADQEKWTHMKTGAVL
jgi:hypothetical protein